MDSSLRAHRVRSLGPKRPLLRTTLTSKSIDENKSIEDLALDKDLEKGMRRSLLAPKSKKTLGLLRAKARVCMVINRTEKSFQSTYDDTTDAKKKNMLMEQT